MTGRFRTLVVVAFALSAFWLGAAPDSRADTTVYALPGQVGVVGDDGPNNIDVWASPVIGDNWEVSPDWSFLSVAAAGIAERFASFVPIWIGMMPEHYKVFGRVRAGMSQTYARLQSGSYTFKTAVARSATFIKAALRDISLVGHTGAVSVGLWFTEDFQYLRGLAMQGNVLAFTALGSVLGRDRVLIRVKGGAVNAYWPCRQVQRAIGSRGMFVQDAVSCPAPVFPGPTGFATGLYVDGRDGRDNINVAFSRERFPQGWKPQEDPFDASFIFGGPGPDTIEGSDSTRGGEYLTGGPGPDTIYGRAGDDYLYGNGFGDPDLDLAQTSAAIDDNDRLFGGYGGDVIAGQSGDDLIFGGKGDDTAWIGRALSGGPGNDTIVGGEGYDELSGGYGLDSLFAKESDFHQLKGDSGPLQQDFEDTVVDCGPKGTGVTGNEYYRASSFDAAPRNCNIDVSPPPTMGQIQDPIYPFLGRWPWFR